MNALAGRVAVVTGSSRGIGTAIALRFTEEGAHLVLHGRDREALERVRARIADAGGDAMVVVADLTDGEQVEAMRDRIERRFDVVDVLVANAGGSPIPPMSLEDIPSEGGATRSRRT